MARDDRSLLRHGLLWAAIVGAFFLIFGWAIDRFHSYWVYGAAITIGYVALYMVFRKMAREERRRSRCDWC